MRWTVMVVAMAGCGLGSGGPGNAKATFSYACERAVVDTHGADDHVSCACPCSMEVQSIAVQANPPRAGVNLNVAGPGLDSKVECSWTGAAGEPVSIDFDAEGVLSVRAPGDNVNCSQTN